MAKLVIGVEGMSCNHCKMAVEKALKTLDGVKEAVVSLENKNAEVEYDEDVVDVEKLKKAIKDAGYQPV
ncbi:copper chaperone CopZ [Desulfothermus okinawensis JCM 13304]